MRYEWQAGRQAGRQAGKRIVMCVQGRKEAQTRIIDQNENAKTHSGMGFIFSIDSSNSSIALVVSRPAGAAHTGVVPTTTTVAAVVSTTRRVNHSRRDNGGGGNVHAVTVPSKANAISNTRGVNVIIMKSREYKYSLSPDNKSKLVRYAMVWYLVT